MAKYREIAADIRDRRLGAEFSVGDRLPGISDLQDEYGGVALNTVRGALNLLVKEKLLRIDPGIGSFVIATPADQAADPLATVRAAHEALGEAIDSVTAEIGTAGRDSLLSAADDLEAIRPALPTANVPAWLRDRAARDA